MAFTSTQLKLSKIFSTQFRYEVSRFQRHYEWGQEQMGQLIYDMNSFCKTKPAKPQPYFLGNFIFHGSPKSKIRKVVDGQQRLTSLLIILAVCRDMIANANKKQANNIHSYLLLPSQDGKKRQPSLKLGRNDHNYFRQNVLNEGATSKVDENINPANPSHARLRDNIIVARNWFKGKTEYEIRVFYTRLLLNCEVISLLVDNEQEAFRIFETVNGRGLPLRSEDIVRYDLVDLAADGDVQRVGALLTKWDDTERSIKQEYMPQFMEMIRAVRAPLSFCPQPHSAFKRANDIIDSFNSPKEAKNFLDTQLSEEAKIYKYVYKKNIAGIGNTTIGKQISFRLWSLSLVTFHEWLPSVRQIMVNHLPNKEYDKIHEQFVVLDQIAWYYFLKQGDRFADEDRCKRFKLILQFLQGDNQFADRMRLSPGEKADMRRFISGPINEKSKALKFLLIRMEMVLNPRWRESIFFLKNRAMTIEHVLPLSPRSFRQYWFEKFGGLRKISEQTRKIGNLCLVSDELNTEMDDHDFPKKQELANEDRTTAHTILAEDLWKVPDWTPAIIARRSGRIFKVFCATFDVDS